jgi:hypothetical protein
VVADAGKEEEEEEESPSTPRGERAASGPVEASTGSLSLPELSPGPGGGTALCKVRSMLRACSACAWLPRGLSAAAAAPCKAPRPPDTPLCRPLDGKKPPPPPPPAEDEDEDEDEALLSPTPRLALMLLALLALALRSPNAKLGKCPKPLNSLSIEDSPSPAKGDTPVTPPAAAAGRTPTKRPIPVAPKEL